MDWGDSIIGVASGLTLDGEMTDVFGETVLPSGDGVEGGDAVVGFHVIGSRRPTGRLRLTD